MPTPSPIIVASIGRDRSDVGDRRDHVHDRDADPEAEERGEDRQPHRHDRAEREQQDHDRGEQPDEVGVALRRLVGVVDHRAAVRQLDAGLRRRRGRLLDLVEDVLGKVLRLGVELHRHHGDLAVLRDEGGTERPVGIGDGGDVRDLLERGDALADRRLDGRAGDPGVGLEHDECVVAGVAREVVLEEVERLLRLGVRDAEVVAELPVEGARERDDRDRHDDPHAEEPPTMAHRAPPQAFEQTRHLVPLVFRRPAGPDALGFGAPGCRA